ncbi:MAG: methyltransferase domain-containing protein [Phycisphaerae bacterium]
MGCVNHTSDAYQDPTWLHGQIVKAASYCLGVDVLEEGVAHLRAAGFNVLRCDITTEKINEKFDLMICGEVIEHIEHIGSIFITANASLSVGGRLLITTPNPYYLNRAWSNLRGRCYDSVDHVSLLSPSGMAELGDRHGLTLVSYRGVLVADARTLMGRSALRCRSLLGIVFSPEAFCETMIYEFEISGSPGHKIEGAQL